MKIKPSLLLKKSSLFLLLITILAIGSCKKDQKASGQQSNTDSKVVAYIKKLGFKQSDIHDYVDYYIVDGDILFAKNAIIDTTKTKLDANSDPSQLSKLRTEQTGTGSYVGANINVIIQVDPSMSNYVNEITAAIGQWNSVPGSLVFSIYNGTGPLPNVTIKNVNLGTGYCGLSQWPINGHPGALIEINEAFMANYSFDQRQINIAHELGHVIGLRHTNWYINNEPVNGTDAVGSPAGAVQIPGTPDKFTGDPNSIMNGGLCGQDPITLSNFDKIAFQYLYPKEVFLSSSVNDIDADNNLVGYVEIDYSQPYIGPPTQTWPAHGNILPLQFFPYQGVASGSFDNTKAQLQLGNAQISNYTEPNQTFQIYTNTGGAASSTVVSQAVGYINYYLTHGFPVVVGVRNGAGYPGGPDHDLSTNHFVVLVDLGTDSNGNYYRFYDNSTSFASKGASTLNKLYYNPTTRIISGTSQASYCVNGYIVTQVRKSKGTD